MVLSLKKVKNGLHSTMYCRSPVLDLFGLNTEPKNGLLVASFEGTTIELLSEPVFADNGLEHK